MVILFPELLNFICGSFKGEELSSEFHCEPTGLNKFN